MENELTFYVKMQEPVSEAPIFGPHYVLEKITLALNLLESDNLCERFTGDELNNIGVYDAYAALDTLKIEMERLIESKSLE